ncbi:LytR/AlgR family response regulator transcription factor [Spirosoma foliorum]|uniref:Response regulator transcription factor n=1 Tax=Spirosoma foliorum TaxID=2710596 RepID=A0A7G5H2V8_9BACT|nr:LytTR family DNA-binding domain-containing protein [Spirosoma foliorum]QMW05450.1 response regulator transcription factor [Spirosoma foliorum]
MEKPITCLLIDDEPLARNLLERFIARVPFLNLVGTYSNAIDAMVPLYETKLDLLFLDVQMPEVTGFNLLDMLTAHRPQVILTTAYSQYAVSGFDYNVTDYLLKPIQFERFLRAVHKVYAQQENVPALPTSSSQVASLPQTDSPPTSTDPYIWIPVNKTRLHLNTKDIVFIESLKDYVKIHLQSKTLVVRLALYKIEQLLPIHQFIRIHRSFLVRRDAISAVHGSMVEFMNKQQLPIGISYRESIREKLK